MPNAQTRKTVIDASDVPDSHKIAVYDALCKHFASVIEQDSYFETSEEILSEHEGIVAEKTECVGISLEYDEMGRPDGLFVLAEIRGWADNTAFVIPLPEITKHDRIGDSELELIERNT